MQIVGFPMRRLIYVFSNDIYVFSNDNDHVFRVSSQAKRTSKVSHLNFEEADGFCDVCVDMFH